MDGEGLNGFMHHMSGQRHGVASSIMPNFKVDISYKYLEARYNSHQF